jgi:uncharacterized protein (TIGR02453 family)
MQKSKLLKSNFTLETINFFKEIENNNNKEWFHTHKADYENFVKGPLLSLINDLEFLFGQAHMFRPNRDIRFSNNKNPYKTSASFFINSGNGGYYFEIDSQGIMVGGGIFDPESDQLLKWRQTFDGENRIKMKKIINELQALGYQFFDGDRLKTAPRGWNLDHKDIELLQLKKMAIFKKFNIEQSLQANLSNTIKLSFEQIKEFNLVLDKYIGPSKNPKNKH